MHFLTLVFKEADEYIDDILAPYGENEERYFEFQPCDEGMGFLKQEYEEYNDKSVSFNKFVNEEYGYERNPYTGEYGYYSNPHAEYDYYTVIDNWNGFSFKDKSGTEKYNVCLSDIDLSSVPDWGVSFVSTEDGWSGIARDNGGMRTLIEKKLKENPNLNVTMIDCHI